VNRRTGEALALASLALLGAGLLVLGLGLGSASIPWRQSVAVVLGEEAPAWVRTVLLQVRGPRVFLAFAIGASLAAAGAALQGVFKNPLADPGVLGVSACGALGAVLAIFVGAVGWSPATLPLAACAFALAGTLMIYGLAARAGRLDAGAVVLAGVGVGSLASAATALVISLSLANYAIGAQILQWLMGGLDGRGWFHVRLASPALLLGVLLIHAHRRDLDALLLGDVHALAVGVDVGAVRRRIILATSLITGASVAVAGVIGFVGLVVPHLIRLTLGPSHRVLLPASTLLGGAFLVGADTLARRIIAPQEVQLGVITAAVGAPIFVHLLVREQRREER
jgi:iron complex transport system permease protein